MTSGYWQRRREREQEEKEKIQEEAEDFADEDDFEPDGYEDYREERDDD